MESNSKCPFDQAPFCHDQTYVSLTEIENVTDEDKTDFEKKVEILKRREAHTRQLRQNLESRLRKIIYFGIT